MERNKQGNSGRDTDRQATTDQIERRNTAGGESDAQSPASREGTKVQHKTERARGQKNL